MLYQTYIVYNKSCGRILLIHFTQSVASRQITIHPVRFRKKKGWMFRFLSRIILGFYRFTQLLYLKKELMARFVFSYNLTRVNRLL